MDLKKEGVWVAYNEDGSIDQLSAGTFRNGVKVE